MERRAAPQVVAEIGARADVDVEVIGAVLRFPDVEAGDLAEEPQMVAGALGQSGPLWVVVETIADRAQPFQEARRGAFEVALEDDGVVELGEQVGVDVFRRRVIIRIAGPQHEGPQHEDEQEPATKHGGIKQRQGGFRKSTVTCLAQL